MQPKIVNAERVESFHLPSGYAATLLGNIESAGVIEYHQILVIFGPDEQVCLFTGSEWNSLDPSYKEEPVFGVFDEMGHSGLGGSADWIDPALFVLRSIDYVREHFKLSDTELCEGEAWALTQLLKHLQESSEGEASPRQASYFSALAKNDARLVAYMKQHANI